MFKQAVFQWLAFLGFLYLIILFYDPRCSDPLQDRIQATSATVKMSTKVPQNVIHKKDVDARLTEELAQVADLQREIIRNDMKDYPYPNGKYDISAKKLEDLLIEESGKPIRNIILTTWRSGSTFFSDVITAHPATFHHHEPLLDFNIVQIRGPPLAADALKRSRTLFDCEYADLDKYINYSEAHPWALYFNAHVWKQCKAHRDLCFDHKFLSTMCRLFPFQLMKLTRLRLNVAQELFTDEKLAVRMVLLVRDPRGTLQSRKHNNWCPPSRDCSDPALLCADLASDYKVAIELLKKYPTRFKVIRYEDLAAEPYKSVREISEFYGLDFHNNMKVFLDTHTKSNKGGAYSTYRDSKKAPFHWKTELKFEEVKEIQRSCDIAMEYWGYLPASNATHQREFNPITNYILS